MVDWQVDKFVKTFLHLYNVHPVSDHQFKARIVRIIMGILR